MSSKSFDDVMDGIALGDIAAEVAKEFNLTKSATDDVELLVECFSSAIDDESLSDDDIPGAIEKSAGEFVEYWKGNKNAPTIADRTYEKVRAVRGRRKLPKKKKVMGAPAAQFDGQPGKEFTMTKITKKFVLGQLESLANLQKRNNETPQQAFARFMETAEGAAGYRAYKSLPDDEPSAIEASIAPSRDTELPAFQAISKRAVELRAADPKLSEAGAFAKVYEAPESAALREAYKRERAAIAA